jgi:histone-binding protein RBBP4
MANTDLISWDTRSDSASKPSQQVVAHSAEVNAIAFAPSSSTLFITGSSDKVSSARYPLDLT